MAWTRRLHRLPLREKVLVTFVGVVAVLLAASMIFSFRYWEREFVEVSREQASLAATSARAALESTVPGGRLAAGRRNLDRLVGGAPVTAARVYGPDGRILLSSDRAEEGERPTGLWMARGDTVFSFLPVSLAPEREGVLEIVLPVGGMKTAMERGALLGIGLMLLSFVALGFILLTMLEHEVVGPLHRMENELGAPDEDGPAAGDEVGRLAHSVTRLLEREREAEARAAERHRELQARSGFAEVGELAAEMAHEFKRPLASIQTAVDLLQQEYELGGSGHRVLGEVEHQLDRLRETMGDLFALAKPVAVETAPVPIEEVMDDALLELRSVAAAENVRMERDYQEDLPRVPGDRHRLEQAFLNLLTNAAEAMPEGGTLRARIRTAADGEAVEVTVADTGPGIARDEIEKAVRPFYSTKPLGTGLGLPLVVRIVAAHGGELDIESEPGAGTRVRVLLPLAAERASPTVPSSVEEPV